MNTKALRFKFGSLNANTMERNSKCSYPCTSC